MTGTAAESERRSQACQDIIREILAGQVENPETAKLLLAKKYCLSSVPRNSDVLAAASIGERQALLGRLQLKRVRCISGVHVIGVMTAPRRCPHGRCAYCPSDEDAPTSYTGYEPAAMRAKQNDFDPYGQLTSRLAQLRAIGHKISKLELVIQGGTFLASPLEYQEHFLKRCLDALSGKDSATLREAQTRAESSRIRNVGLTFETRPDWARAEHVDLMLSYGATRVEIGVQSLDDDVLRLVERGHSVRDVVESFRIAKDAGLKVVAHMMPGLPGSTPERDLEGFKKLVADPSFRPDMLKIYPCLVVRGTKVYDWWKNGEYKPLTTRDAVELVAKVKESVPSWMRIMRVQREIPARLIEAGPNKGNLRELALASLAEKGKHCRCIRCREVGHHGLKESPNGVRTAFDLVTTRYVSSGGIEIFLSKEDQVSDTLVGYLRLRIPSSSAHRAELTVEPASIVRELHVYGPAIPIGEHDRDWWQHKGHGLSLLCEAERISREEYSIRKILVLSAIGTREYYARNGYKRDGPYMSKQL